MTDAAVPNDDPALLDDVVSALRTYVVLPSDEYFTAVALWIAHAHCPSAAETTPRLVFKSPEKESGKTRALEVLELLVSDPLPTFSATTAAIFRHLRSNGATILFDEVDAIFGSRSPNNEDLRALLNAGYRRGAFVIRVVGEGAKMRTERFPVFAPTALACIGDLPDTIESRAITVPMRRRAPDESVSPFRRPKARPSLELLRRRLEHWSALSTSSLLDAEPTMPAGVSDRAADLWEPLLAIAETFGSRWAEQGRRAASVIVSGRTEQDQSLGVRLLADVRAIIEPAEKLSSRDLCTRLNALDDADWGGWHGGKGLDQRDIARRFRAYGITPKSVRLPDGSTPKGYSSDQFRDAWSRYLRPPATSATTATASEFSSACVADVAAVAQADGSTPRSVSTAAGYSSIAV
jgi:hypothetical protein